MRKEKNNVRKEKNNVRKEVNYVSQCEYIMK